jgi:hypothetical protein
MKLKRFRTFADCYGSDLERWPERVRQQARALLDSSAEARQIMAGAMELDNAMAAAQAARSERLWSGDRADAALVRLRNSVAARIASRVPATETAGRGTSLPRPARGAPLRVRWISLTTVASVAILAGLVLGIWYSPPASQQDDLSALMQPSPIQLPSD